jgi:hypothetical protein
MWYPSFYRVIFPTRRYAWHRVKILRETDKAILIYNGGKTWVPKSWIYGIRLRNNTLEIYIREGTLA